MAGKYFIIKYVNWSLSENGLNEQIVIYRVTARSMRMERKYYIDNLRWLAILMLFGVGQSKMNFHNRVSIYLTQTSFPVYMLHMPILVVVGFFVLKLPVGVAEQFLLTVLISFIGTFFIYDIVKRMPVLRFLLGMKKQKL